MLNYVFMKKLKLFEEKSIVSKTISGPLCGVGGKNPAGFWLVLNLVLLALVGILGIWYALWTNFSISGKYQENVLEAKLSVLLEENNALLSEKSSLVNLGSLLVFSKQTGLVEQKNIEYLFDRRNVAEAPRNPSQ